METDRAGPPLLGAEALRAVGCDAQPLTLTLKPGDRIGLLGSQGTGLGALLCTLARLQRPAEGHLLWSGVDVTRRPRWLLPERLRARIVLLWANPYALFEGSARVHTLVRARDRATDALPGAWLRAGGLSPALSQFRVGDLSGLARVQMALAYAQRRRPTVILVDDVFAHLIPEGWPGLLATLERIAGETTALVIASRLPEALRTMAQIVDLRDGLKVNA